MADRYEWTRHAEVKMRQYGLSEQRIRRVIRAPFRYEEGVLEKAIAVMQPASVRRTTAGKPTWSSEIWVMYKLASKKRGKSKFEARNPKLGGKTIRIITAWRYPGVSKKRGAIPEEVLAEVRSLL